MDEIWLPIPGFEGIYEVSNKGRVKSLARIVPHKTGGRLTLPEKIRIPSLAATGKYQMICLWKANKQHTRYVHRLVLEAFCGPCPKGFDGCHTDGNRQNNSIENLRWDSRSGNMQDAIRHGTSARGVRHGFSKFKEIEIRAIRADPRMHKEIARDYGVARATIWSIKSGENWGWLK